MSETVKIIIEIPKEDYLNAKRVNWANIRPECVDDYEYQIAHGIPLDDVKAEIEKEIIPRNSDDYDHDAMYQNCGLRIALKIIDNIGNETEEGGTS